MAIGYSRYLNTIYLIGDIIILNFSFAAISFFQNKTSIKVNDAFLSHFFYINLVWLITVFIFRINEIDRTEKAEQVISTILKTVVVYGLILLSLNYLLVAYIHPVKDFLLKFGLFVALLIWWRSVMLGIISLARKRGLNYRRVIIIGGGQLATDMKDFFQTHGEFGYRLQGIFNDNHTSEAKETASGNVEQAKQFAVENLTDEIFCSISELKQEQIVDLMKFCDQNLVRFKMIPDFRGMMHRRVKIDFYNSTPVLTLRSEPLESSFSRFIKRTFDIIFSLFIIVFIFSWLFPIIAFLIRTGSKGPVFFKQKRSGKKNNEFVCWKFRTMRVNDEADEVQATKNDGRITGIGKFLRRTNLDELPQFFNVLIGQMSIVGPRPHMLRHTEEYAKMIDKFMVRHLVQPGITGWAQVSGYRGETREQSKMEKRVEHDVWYIENWSLLLDIKIIFLTIRNMLTGDENAR